MTHYGSTVRFLPTREDLAAGFHSVLDTVARERRYIGFIVAPPLEEIARFVRQIAQGELGIQLLAVTDNDVVVGWCDIMRNPHEPHEMNPRSFHSPRGETNVNGRSPVHVS